MQLALGSFIFGLNTLPYQSEERSTDYSWASNERVGTHNALQFLGIGEDRMTLPGVVYPELKGSVTASFNELRAMAASGQPYLLISLTQDATEQTGDIHGKWVIQTITEQKRELLGSLPRKIEFSLELQRYAV